jgi:hypothetical protein
VCYLLVGTVRILLYYLLQSSRVRVALMSNISAWILPFTLLVVFEAFADIFAKEWQDKRGVYLAAASLFCYLVANSFWLFALKNGSGLARGASSLQSLVQFSLLVLVGGFTERLLLLSNGSGWGLA